MYTHHNNIYLLGITLRIYKYFYFMIGYIL
nr:MAG TPA: hypothetical protein [Caudoviricetes sp.]